MKLSNLSKLSTKDLQDRFSTVFGKPTTSRNRPWLIKRLFTAPTAEVLSPVKAKPAPPPVALVAPSPVSAEQQATTIATEVIPPVGAEIRKTWKDQELVVRVQADGFLLRGTVYRSLSAAATALCGGNRNGLVFFGLKPRPAKVAQGKGGAA
jgi:hypothetical protein